MRIEDVQIVEYTKREEAINCVSHALGAILSGLIVAYCAVPAFMAEDPLRIFCALFYLLGTTATFVLSVAYHAAKPGKSKRYLRLLDHLAVFFAVAGTAVGCVPAVYDTVGRFAAALMLFAAVLGVAAGLTVTLLGFEKLKALKMAIYIATALVCAVCGGKAYSVLPVGAFLAFLGGSSLLIAGIIIYGLGRKKRYFHCVFHFFILGGLFVYWLGISAYCY